MVWLLSYNWQSKDCLLCFQAFFTQSLCRVNDVLLRQISGEPRIRERTDGPLSDTGKGGRATLHRVHGPDLWYSKSPWARSLLTTHACHVPAGKGEVQTFLTNPTRLSTKRRPWTATVLLRLSNFFLLALKNAVSHISGHSRPATSLSRLFLGLSNHLIFLGGDQVTQNVGVGGIQEISS